MAAADCSVEGGPTTATSGIFAFADAAAMAGLLGSYQWCLGSGHQGVVDFKVLAAASRVRVSGATYRGP